MFPTNSLPTARCPAMLEPACRYLLGHVLGNLAMLSGLDTIYYRGVQSYPERASVGAGFCFSPARRHLI